MQYSRGCPRFLLSPYFDFNPPLSVFHFSVYSAYASCRERRGGWSPIRRQQKSVAFFRYKEVVQSGWMTGVDRDVCRNGDDSNTVWRIWRGCVTLYKNLKGQCHEIFCFRFFSWIIFPQSPENNIRIHFDIRKSRCTTGVNDTGGKFWLGKPPTLVLCNHIGKRHGS